MSEQDNLTQKRDAIIERIKQAFPKKPPRKNMKLTLGRYLAEEERLREMLKDKKWEEIIAHPQIRYNLTEVDHLREITDDAYRYYLPAFLTASLLDPTSSFILAIERIIEISSRFSLEQLDILIIYLEFQMQFWRDEPPYPDDFVIEFTQERIPQLIYRRDELANKQAK